MIETKTRDDILLEEKIAQIDDINFDKIYDVEEFAAKKIESFEDAENTIKDKEIVLNDNAKFEMEIEPNEFLDSFSWEEKKEEVVKNEKKAKNFILGKPLFFTFTSIAFLLCILLIYNVFVINSLSSSLNQAKSVKVANAYSSVNVNNENNYINIDDTKSIEIEYDNTQNNINEESLLQTNWFDYICGQINKLFGG